MYLDGVLYVAIAIFTFLQTVFGGDEAAKYISPVNLFWLKLAVGVCAAGALALKLYRSTAFAENKAAVAAQTVRDNGGPSTDIKVTPAPIPAPVVTVTKTDPAAPDVVVKP